MKKLILLMVAVALLAGCSTPDPKTSEEYKALESTVSEKSREVDDLKSKLESLTKTSEEASKKAGNLEDELATVKKEFSDYQEKMMPYAELSESEVAAKKAEADAQKAEKEAAEAAAKAEKDAIEAKAKADAELEATRVKADKEAIENEAVNRLAEMRAASAITLTTGSHTVGEHIPAGRYKVSSAGGSGNFIVTGSTPYDLKANEILGDWGVAEVIVNLKDKDTVEISGMSGAVFIIEP